MIVPSSAAIEVVEAVPAVCAQAPPPLAVPQPVWLARWNVSWTTKDELTTADAVAREVRPSLSVTVTETA